jgi:O-antigen/teichoic acid export membrane protein
MPGTLKNTYWALVDRCTQLLFSFLAFTIIAHLWEKTFVGEYAILSSYLLLVYAASSFALQNVFVFLNSKNPKYFWSRFYSNYICIKAVFLFIFGSFYCVLFYSKVDLEFLIVIFILLFASIIEPREWYLISRLEQKKIFIARFGAIVIGLPIKLFVIFNYESPALLVVIYAMESTLFFVLLYEKTKRKLGFNFNKVSLIMLRYLFGKGKPLILSMIAIMLYSRADQYMLLLLSTTAELADHAVVLRLVEPVNFVAVAICSSFLTLLAKNKEPRDFNVIATSFAKKLWASSLTIVIVIVLLSNQILEIFGSNFSHLSNLLILLSITIPISFILVMNGLMLVAEGKQKLAAKRSLVALVINIMLNYIFIPKYGALGAVLSTIATMIISLLFYYIHKSTTYYFHINFLIYVNKLKVAKG